MTRRSIAEGLSSPAVSAVTGASVRLVNKVADERLPAALVRRRANRRLIAPLGVLCVAIDMRLPREVPSEVRREAYARLARTPAGRRDALRRLGHLRIERGPILAYDVRLGPLAAETEAAIARYRGAMALIVEDPEIQGGAATFKGTRILVHHVAGLLAQGETEARLREDMPRLTPAMVEAARVYAKAHPRRGRPRMPSWGGGAERAARD